jgi:MFS transporter, AAHS family, 4-hydroxybenzoate transporter
MRLRTCNVTDFIDRNPVSAFQKRIALLIFLFITIDGFDIASIGFIAPALRAEFGVPPSALAPVFAASFFGLLIGSIVAGPTADRFGRKPVLIGSMVFFAAASVGAAFCDNLDALFWARLLTGLGLGGAFPTAVTLVSEYYPARISSRMTALAVTGFSAGSALGGFVVAQVLQTVGWRGILLIGGVVPLVLAIVGAALLPESVKYLVFRGGQPARIRSILCRIGPCDNNIESFVAIGVGQNKAPVTELFRHGQATTTICLWVTFFMSQLVIYLMTGWLPLLLTEKGTPVSSVSIVVSMLQFCSIPGALALGYLMDRSDARGMLAIAYALGAIFVAATGFGKGNLMYMFASISAVGLTAGGAMIGMYALAARSYSVPVRATGVSWAASAGRFGAIAGSLGGGAMLQLGFGFSIIFLGVAAVTAIAAVSLAVMRLASPASPAQSRVAVMAGSADPQ